LLHAAWEWNAGRDRFETDSRTLASHERDYHPGKRTPRMLGTDPARDAQVGALSLLGGLFNTPSLLALERIGEPQSASRAGQERAAHLPARWAATQDMF